MKETRIEMTGVRYGQLVALRYAGRNKDGRALWLFSCDCGNQHIASGRFVRAGRTQSCGCLHKEVASQLRRSHAMSKTPTYATWSSMLGRCYNPNHSSFPKYGALGVRVCDEWRNSFEQFFVDMGARPNGMTLDRVNPFGNYEKENCAWATAVEQANNRRGQAAIAILKKLGINPSEHFE